MITRRLMHFGVLAAIGCTTGCGGGGGATRAPVRYVSAAQFVPDEPPPVVVPTSVLVSEQRLEPGALPPNPRLPKPREAVEEDNKAAYEVVDAANHAAAQGPKSSGYYNAIQEFVFEPGSLYQIYSAPTRVTDIALQPGERIEGQVVIGDLVRWIVGVSKVATSAGEQQHVYLKPTRPGLETNLTINTSLRTYFCEIHSYKETYMVSVKWRYPQDEIARMVQSSQQQYEQNKSTTSIGASPADLNFRYARTILAGPARWAPTQVFDDGKKTYIHFPRDVTSGEVPVLFVVHGDQVQLVNYRAKRDTYIVDRLFDVAELRVGTNQQEIVRLERM